MRQEQKTLQKQSWRNRKNTGAAQLFPSSLSGNTRAGFLPRYHKVTLSWPHHPSSSFPKSCHVQNKTSAQAGQRRMRYFLLGSAFSFSLKKLRPGKKPASVSCCASVLTSPGLAGFPCVSPHPGVLAGWGARPWALEALIGWPSQSLGKCGQKQSISNAQLCPPRHARLGLQQVEGSWRVRERVCHRVVHSHRH